MQTDEPRLDVYFVISGNTLSKSVEKQSNIIEKFTQPLWKIDSILNINKYRYGICCNCKQVLVRIQERETNVWNIL